MPVNRTEIRRKFKAQYLAAPEGTRQNSLAQIIHGLFPGKFTEGSTVARLLSTSERTLADVTSSAHGDIIAVLSSPNKFIGPLNGNQELHRAQIRLLESTDHLSFAVDEGPQRENCARTYIDWDFNQEEKPSDCCYVNFVFGGPDFDVYPNGYFVFSPGGRTLKNQLPYDAYNLHDSQDVARLLEFAKSQPNVIENIDFRDDIGLFMDVTHDDKQKQRLFLQPQLSYPALP